MKRAIKFPYDPMNGTSRPVTHKELEQFRKDASFRSPAEYGYQVLLRPNEVGIVNGGRTRLILKDEPRPYRFTRSHDR